VPLQQGLDGLHTANIGHLRRRETVTLPIRVSPLLAVA
jgi:hypothetical protein